MGKAYFCEKDYLKMQVENRVPENLRKKQERDNKAATALTAAREQRRKAMVAKKADWLKRGQAHYENHVNEQKRLVDAKRTAQAKGELFVPAQQKVFLVVRTKGINKVGPKEKLILRLLRLRQMHNATLLKVNKATMNMLRRVEPWVTYGFPNRKTVEQLVYKRGYGKVNGQRVRLSNNFVVEDNLKKAGMVCVE